ncbi:hypothetical protein XENOCAPTIV_021985 [Xenoophorus captivus]|uniref:Uncharacterized protein n=1 Tax=Xenoophorus captivus TaxID=1517983 RepID=A0ABV0RJS2_9TELE
MNSVIVTFSHGRIERPDSEKRMLGSERFCRPKARCFGYTYLIVRPNESRIIYKCEKLDYKACESLEEILKRVQFKVIDLEQTNLDEDVR